MTNEERNPDGTERLCLALYGEVRARNYLGGSNASMLHDAANRLALMSAVIDALPLCMTEGCRKKAMRSYFDVQCCDEHSDAGYSDLPYARALRALGAE